ncbi:MAG: hypothetical protein AAFR24_21560 [Cyanobacteria bacterium J06627_3]
MSSTPTSPTSPAGPISVVDASQLPTLSASESQPVPSSPPAPAVPRSPPVDPPWTVDVPISETSDGPEPAPEAASAPDWTADASTPEPGDHPISSNAPDAVPNAGAAPNNNSTSGTAADEEAKVAAAEWEQLVGYFKDQDEGFGLTLFETFDFFKKSEQQIDQFFDENNQPKLNVSSFYYFQEKTPEQVFRDVVMPELNNNKGFDLQPQENFPAGLAYQLLQGEVLRYLIIVGLSEDNGSVLLLSESLSGLEP